MTNPSRSAAPAEAFPRLPVTAIVTCFNEAAVIEECLQSLAFADEILVVDSFSTDATLEIARRYTDRILQNPFWSHGAQVNWATPQARHDWILVVDSDERVTPELAAELRERLPNPGVDALDILRRNIFLGREIRYGTWSSDWVVRLFHRGRARYEERRVHSKVIVTGTTGRCRERLLHYSYRSIEDCLRKVQRFSRAGALEAFERGQRSSGWKIFSRGIARFLKSYVLKRGFLDGIPGLIVAFLEADHAFHKYAKLWELQTSGAAGEKKSDSPTPTPAPTVASRV